LFPKQYVVHFGRLLLEQYFLHLGEGLMHNGQSDCGGGVGIGVAVGIGVGVGFGLDVGVAVEVGADVEWGCGVGDDVAPGAADVPGAAEGCPAEVDGGADDMRPGELKGWPGMSDAPGDGGGGPNPPTVSTVAVTALSAPVPAQVPKLLKACQRRPRLGIWPIHAPIPTMRQRRPIEMLRNARTMAGSSWVPATRVNSRRASATLMVALYGRGEVITS